MQIEFESFINEVSFYICYENRGKNKMPYGIVKEINFDSKYGNYIIIKNNEDFETLYTHLDEITIKEGFGVTVPDRLRQHHDITIPDR